MTHLPILAHGVLGNLDEALFLGVVVLFVLTLIASWVQGHGLSGDDPAQSDTRGEFK